MPKRILALTATFLSALALSAQVEYIDITLTNGQVVSYPISSVASVSFHTEALPGDGSREHPYSVREALVAHQTQTAAQKVWVKGVIVGSVCGSYMSEVRIGNDTCSNTNILLANSVWETSASRCLPVQLPAGAVRSALNIKDNPDNYHRELLIYATLDKYFAVAGLKTPSDFEIGKKADADIDPAGPHPGCIEVPGLINGDEFITHTAYISDESTERVPNYYVSYSPSAHHAHWVAYRFDATTRQKNTLRTGGSTYPVDPDSQSSLPSNGFTGTGYDHGHICASADRLYSSLANEQTFYMTNMSPQIPNFNRGYWRSYESWLQDYAADASLSDTIYVVKGGTIATGQVSSTISCNGISVPVPKYYFVALLKVKDAQYSALGFWIEHREYETVKDKVADFRAHAVSIDELETLTGFNFFPALPDNIEQAVEASYDTASWGL